MAMSEESGSGAQLHPDSSGPLYHLEQIADLSVSIAEEAAFFHKGWSIRHRHEDL